jgi:hypothetical protein
LPFRPGQPGLGLGRPSPAERGEIKGERPPAAENPREEQGLVETPFPKAGRVKGNRKDKIRTGKGKFGVLVFSQKISQGPGEPCHSPELIAGDGLHDDPLIPANRPGTSKITLFGEALGTQMIDIRRGGKGRAAAGAPRRREERDPGQTGRTGAVDGIAARALATERAFGGKKEINQSAPEGAQAQAHNRAGKL